MIGRRAFITLLGGVAAGWPHAARAQTERMRRVAVLALDYSPNDREGQARITAFLDALQKQGWSDGRNIHIELRWGGSATVKSLAAELVNSAPDVVVADGNVALTEVHQRTNTIPIVFVQVSDSVGAGFVSSLSRPGGNITGFENFAPTMAGKWMGVLKDATPNVRRAAVLFSSNSANNFSFLRSAESVASSLGVTVDAVDVQTSEIEGALAAFASQSDGGLLVIPNPRTIAERSSIIILAARHRLPAVYPFSYFADEGGLIAYGPDLDERWRGTATYVDRILRGEKPGDLPVQAPTKYELIINMKTAKALGLSIPPAFPLRADRVIE